MSATRIAAVVMWALRRASYEEPACHGGWLRESDVIILPHAPPLWRPRVCQDSPHFSGGSYATFLLRSVCRWLSRDCFKRIPVRAAARAGRRTPGVGRWRRVPPVAAATARRARRWPPRMFKVEWVQPAGQTGQVPIVQGNVADPNVEVHWVTATRRSICSRPARRAARRRRSARGPGECDGPLRSRSSRRTTCSTWSPASARSVGSSRRRASTPCAPSSSSRTARCSSAITRTKRSRS